MAIRHERLLSKPITSREEAEAFIAALHEAGMLFHFDDNPREVVRRGEERVFSDDEAALLDARVDELFKLDWDPHEFAVELLDAAEAVAAGESAEERVERSQWPKACGCGARYEGPSVFLAETEPAYVREDEFSVNVAGHCRCGSTLEAVAICLDASLE